MDVLIDNNGFNMVLLYIYMVYERNPRLSITIISLIIISLAPSQIQGVCNNIVFEVDYIKNKDLLHKMKYIQNLILQNRHGVEP
jgi:hypothetical protein